MNITSSFALCLKTSCLQFSLCPWRVKLLEREIDRSPPSTPKSKNVWSCTLIRPVCPHGAGKGKFTVSYRLTWNRKPHKAVSVLLRGGSDKSLARPTSLCHTTESIVSLERWVCSCAELQVFACYRDWKEACQATRAVSTTSRRELSWSFFFPTKTIERSPFFVRRGGHCCRRDLVGRTSFWFFFFEWLAKLWATG